MTNVFIFKSKSVWCDKYFDNNRKVLIFPSKFQGRNNIHKYSLKIIISTQIKILSINYKFMFTITGRTGVWLGSGQLLNDK